jgi:rRNA-processing protein FCF1
MPAAFRSPLQGTDRLIVDGTNMLYRMAGNRGTAAPPAALVGRLRAVIPPAVTIELVFDGMAHGIKGRVAQQMFVRYSGRRTGDELVLELAGLDDEGVLVITDDRGLRGALQVRGVRTAPLALLISRLALPALSSPSAGNRRPPIGAGRAAGGVAAGGAAGGPGASDDDERTGWKPGRGATTKTGPMHKVARHRRHPKHP